MLSAYNVDYFVRDRYKSILPDCPYALDSAKRDIKKMKLFVAIGFVGTQNLDMYLCELFERHYNVKLEYMGCLRFCNSEK